MSPFQTHPKIILLFEEACDYLSKLECFQLGNVHDTDLSRAGEGGFCEMTCKMGTSQF